MSSGARQPRPLHADTPAGNPKRPVDKRRERFDAADRKIHAPSWTDAVRALSRDPGATVPCPNCAEGVLTADWLAFESRAGGEWVVQCVSCGAWHSEVRAARDRG